MHHTTHAIRRAGIAGLASVAALGALTAPASGAASKDPRPGDRPILTRTSPGAAVTYALEAKTRRQAVTIAGRRATVKLIDAKANLYRAFISRKGLKTGKRYRVTIKAGGRTVHDGRLVLRRTYGA